MKKLVLAAALFAALPACAALTTAIPIVTSLAPAASDASGKVILEGTRGLIIANNAYQGATAALIPLVKNGKLSREQLQRIAEIDNKAYALLSTSGNGLTQAQRAAQVLNMVDELNRIAGK